MSRQSWSAEEDHTILNLVGEHGLNDWTRIAEKLREEQRGARRSGKQCRERWYNHLNPSVNKQPWSSEEQSRLFLLHKQHGNRWKDISHHFLGRTDNDIKNHFYSTLRRSLRRLNKISGEKNSTSQMREIKPSVLSTIMHFIYEGDHPQSDLLLSLQQLPTLIFEFANYKPVKSNLRQLPMENTKHSIANIFALVNKFNEEYEKSKQDRQKRPKLPLPKREQIRQAIIKGTEQAINQEKFCSESTLKDQQRGPQLNEYQSGVKEQCQQGSDYDLGLLQARRQMRNMSFDLAYHQMQIMPEVLQPQQADMMSEQKGESIDLMVVGKHWQPQGWQRDSDLKVFVDQVLQINYNH